MTRARAAAIAGWLAAGGLAAGCARGAKLSAAEVVERNVAARGGRDAWRHAIDMVEDLRPRWIVAGHKNKDLDDDATRVIAETRQYLDDVDELLKRSATPLEFFRAMLERYPTRLNPGALWGGAKALYPSLESSAKQIDARVASPGRTSASS